MSVTKGALARYALPRQAFQRASAAELLVNGGAAYPAMLEAIDAARTAVALETFALQSDATGRRFGEALARAAGRGVDVRVVYDAIGSRGISGEFVRGLAAAGVKIAVYHPLRVHRPLWAWNKRDHRKVLVVDGAVSFTGGLGITDEYAPREWGGEGWRDTHARVDGEEPAAALLALFDAVWRRVRLPADGGPGEVRPERRWRVRWRWTRAHPLAGASAAGGLAVSILGNSEWERRRLIRRAYRHAIDAARESVLIENAYFIPDRGFRRALVSAARRGVQVAVAVARHSDVAAAAWASRAAWDELLKGGVRIHEWPAGMLHAKTAVVDEAWSVVGSYNLDHRSLFHNLEAVAILLDHRFSRRLAEQTRADLALCEEVTLEAWRERPWMERLLERAASLVAFWL
jgi:cardiolipin synthase